ncbi:MgtC/SapB family protein [Sphingomonas cannabina]|uniref:MgtC/SapB family protein n=1 Tax=Sphingomonas cannabina TaxID=2899123 RepID=UPI001F23497F|nr:MgtC/SapB family protein [Sphingomonas cannabina]UIJ46307.1 MgtC/SapB family protein [Sphingomonas cannabina]
MSTPVETSPALLATPAWDVLLPLGYALAIGLLIGLERGWSDRDDPSGTRVAGIRTFAVLGVLGGIAALLPAAAMAVLIGACGAVLAIGYVRQSGVETGRSATSALAGLSVLGLGALAVSGRPVEALACAAALMLLLSMRQNLHHLLKDMSGEELRAAARFAILALVLLPLAPDRPLGPYGAWNPHQLLLVIVLVCGLSFVGYVVARRAEATRGMLLTAACGAIVSSTAVTATFARRLTGANGADRALNAGIALASAISIARVLLLVALLAPHALGRLAIVFVPPFLLLLAATAWRTRGASDDQPTAVALDNPLELAGAIGLALLVALTALASRWALDHYGHMGSAVVLGLTGLADVDAAVIVFAGLPIGPASANLASALALPVALNMAVKAGITLAFARGRGGAAAAAPLALATGLIGLAFVLA